MQEPAMQKGVGNKLMKMPVAVRGQPVVVMQAVTLRDPYRRQLLLERAADFLPPRPIEPLLVLALGIRVQLHLLFDKIGLLLTYKAHLLEFFPYFLIGH